MVGDDLDALRTRLLNAVAAAKNHVFRIPRPERGPAILEKDGQTYAIPPDVNDRDVLLKLVTLDERWKLTKAQAKAIEKKFEKHAQDGSKLLKALRFWHGYAFQTLQPLLDRFTVLANEVVTKLEAENSGCFSGCGTPSRDVQEIEHGALHEDAFGTDDVVEAGRRFLAWAAAAAPGSNRQPRGFPNRFKGWSHCLIATNLDELTVYAEWEPFDWAVQAFDAIVATIVPKSPATAVVQTSNATDQEPQATGASEHREGTVTKAAQKRRARPSDFVHYFACRYAEEKDPANKTTRDAWSYLKEHGIDESDNIAELIGCSIPAKLVAKLATYRVPVFSTFEPAVSKGRGAMDDRKHDSRAGRPFGKSVVRAGDLDTPSVDE
jgi:hypothetical protein